MNGALKWKKISLGATRIQAYIETKTTLANEATLLFEDHNKPLILSTNCPWPKYVEWTGFSVSKTIQLYH